MHNLLRYRKVTASEITFRYQSSLFTNSRFSDKLSFHVLGWILEAVHCTVTVNLGLYLGRSIELCVYFC